MKGPNIAAPVAPDAVEAVAQSRGGPPAPDADKPAGPEPGEGQLYRISQRVDRAASTRLYERLSSEEPLYRPLTIYALDPAVSRLDGGIAALKIQYEPLQSGPTGSILRVDNQAADGRSYLSADLDNYQVLLRGGYTPSLSSPQFHQQMVYAVAMLTYNNFRVALGRNVAWSFEPNDPAVNNRLVLRPHGALEANAWYDRARGEIVFGYFKAKSSTSVVRKDESYVFTCTSHDIIAHEMSHALLDGLRAHFFQPTHGDVLAFHEAFADLVAVFQHFTFEDVVRAEVARSRGNLERADLLVDIAQEFGRSLGENQRALRTLVDLGDEKPGAETPVLTYANAGTEPHKRGRVLANAVFAAFLTMYKRRTRRYLKLATGGTGELPPGDISDALRDCMVAEVRRLANQFLTICIRAIDYCPPVDMLFGDYLRAIITADLDIVPDDDWAYREAFIHAFGARGIYGEGTRSMTEDALVWGGPRYPIGPEPELSFGRMEFDGDPAKPVSVAEMRRQAGALGRLAARAEMAQEFGLVSPHSKAFASGDYSLPIVESVRSARRVGPDKQVVFDIVAEVLQTRRVKDHQGRWLVFYGGSTVILGPRGNVRFIVRKRVDHKERLAAQLHYMQSAQGAAVWQDQGDRIRPARDLSRRLCVRPDVSPEPANGLGQRSAGNPRPSGSDGPAGGSHAGRTVIRVTGPDHLPAGLQVMLDGRFSRIETGATAEVAVGTHTFQVNTGDARYREARYCPAGGSAANPVTVKISTLVSE